MFRAPSLFVCLNLRVESVRLGSTASTRIPPEVNGDWMVCVWGPVIPPTPFGVWKPGGK